MPSPPGARPPSRRPTARPAPRTTGPAARRRVPPPPAPRAGTAGGTSRSRRAAAASTSMPGLAPDVDEHEQQVAQLLGAVGVGVGLDELADLLADLVQHAVDRRPVIAEVRGALLHLLARGERRQRAADAVEGALRRGATPVPLAPSAAAASARSPALIRSHWRLTSLRSAPPPRRTRAGGGGRSSTRWRPTRRSCRTRPPRPRAARGARPGAAGRRARPRAPASRPPPRAS